MGPGRHSARDQGPRVGRRPALRGGGPDQTEESTWIWPDTRALRGELRAAWFTLSLRGRGDTQAEADFPEPHGRLGTGRDRKPAQTPSHEPFFLKPKHFLSHRPVPLPGRPRAPLLDRPRQQLLQLPREPLWGLTPFWWVSCLCEEESSCLPTACWICV